MVDWYRGDAPEEDLDGEKQNQKAYRQASAGRKRKNPVWVKVLLLSWNPTSLPGFQSDEFENTNLSIDRHILD